MDCQVTKGCRAWETFYDFQNVHPGEGRGEPNTVVVLLHPTTGKRAAILVSGFPFVLLAVVGNGNQERSQKKEVSGARGSLAEGRSHFIPGGGQ